MKVLLMAKSHEGFGGKERYEEIVNIVRISQLEDCLRTFALTYKVGLDDIYYNVISK